MALLSTTRVGASPDYIRAEQPAAGDVAANPDSIEYAFRPEALFGAFTRLPQSLAGGDLKLGLRNYYLARSREEQPNSKAWAQGGWLDYDSAWWKNRVRIGATLYTSQKLYGPDDKDGTLLLKPGQESFTVLGEAFFEARLYNSIKARLYRQGLYLPYLNRDDNRMVPITFEAYVVGDTSGERLSFLAGQVEQIKPRASDEFISMTRAAGIEAANRGVTTGGARYTFENGANIGFVNHYGHDFMNTFYTEGTTRYRTLFGLGSQLSVQYTRQSSVGEELGGDFDTWNWGIKAAISYASILVTLAHTRTDSNRFIFSPWGGKPAYTSVMLRDFDRADEKAWLIGLSSDFRAFGFNGLNFFTNLVYGDTPDHGDHASPDQMEFDITLDYRFDEGLLEGLALRLRHAWLDQDGDQANDERDLRAIINYSHPLF